MAQSETSHISKLDRQDLRLDLADILFPGFGFFGAEDPFALRVDIAEELRSLSISVRAPKPEFLNIGEVSFYGSNGICYRRSDIIRSVLMSSIYGEVDEQACFERVINGALIHTKLESEPWLEIEFFAPVFISHITIKSRVKFEGRSRYLVVRGTSAGGDASAFHFENMSSVSKLCALDSLCEAAEFDASVNGPDDVVAAPDLIRAGLLRRIEQGRCGLELSELSYLLPVFFRSDVVGDFDCTVLATLILKYIGGKKYARTKSLSSFQSLLSSAESFQRVQREATRLSLLWNPGRPGQLVISTHGIHFSNLTVRKDVYLQAMRTIVSIFTELGVPLMLAHGTLLGAVREGEFLAHDDDVDLLYVDGYFSEHDMEAGKTYLWDELRSRGVGVEQNVPGKHFKASLLGVKLDMFPTWISGGQTYLYLKGSEYRPVSSDILTPVSSVELYGETFPAPAKPEAFLEARYGPDWTSPDPFFGFPWKVER